MQALPDGAAKECTVQVLTITVAVPWKGVKFIEAGGLKFQRLGSHNLHRVGLLRRDPCGELLKGALCAR